MQVIFGRVGSSPRVRGTVNDADFSDRVARFIPACAGNSTFFLSGDICPRFIPACAGNSGRAAGNRASWPVHPRVCGEQLTAGCQFSASPGSSPRVRGTASHAQQVVGLVRFIPACAGNSRHRDRHEQHESVHPRVCGEQLNILKNRITESGSSPRVRGTVQPRITGRLHSRFIPACAGNSLSARRPGRFSAVHPRVCGEQDSLHLGCLDCRGSSPRVRGTVIEGSVFHFVSRFIPACAGNSA